MNTPWAVRIDPAHMGAVGLLRLHKGILACEVAGNIWLSGDHLDEATELMLRKLAPAERYVVQPDGTLVPAGGQVPRGHLPKADWTPLAQWMTPRVQAAALPGDLPDRVALRLAPGGRQAEPNVLITTWDVWGVYAESAPAIRLAPLRFAGDGTRVLIRGTPLPPLPGQPHVETAGIAVPCGWTWEPAVETTVLRSLLGLGDGDLALLSRDGEYERIPAEAFVRAERSAVRLSLRQRERCTHAAD